MFLLTIICAKLKIKKEKQLKRPSKAQIHDKQQIKNKIINNIKLTINKELVEY
tara:strand:- start:2801 stop:2959 length:159 start_codon:yes stop_codon:yes gene_type:complete